MPLLSDLEGMAVKTTAGKRRGTVSRVVMHPSEPAVVGLEVRRPPLLYVIQLPLAYLPLSLVSEFGAGEVVMSSRRLPSKSVSQREAGLAWDETVVWRGMPVLTRSGDRVGTIADAGFRKLSGAITRVLLSGGAMNDAALGRREIAEALIDGFDTAAEAVIVDDSVLEVSHTGGLADGAGKGAAVAVKAAGKVADRAAVTGEALVDTGKAAVDLTRAAAAAAAASRPGRMATGAVGSLGKAVRKAIAPGDEE